MSVDGERKNHIAEKLEHILKFNFCFNSQKKAHEKEENKRTNDERYKKLEQHFFRSFPTFFKSARNGIY